MQNRTLEWYPKRSPGSVVYYAVLSALGLASLAYGLDRAAWIALTSVLIPAPLSSWHFSTPLLRILPDRIDHRPFHTKRRGVRLRLRPRGFLEQIPSEAVAKLEWDGTDNIGIRLVDDEVLSVSFFEVPPDDQGIAREAILDFVRRAEGMPRAGTTGTG